jgi:hypothetical protein
MARVRIIFSFSELTEEGPDSAAPVRHDGHLCPACNDVDDVVPPSSCLFIGHFDSDGLMMIEADKPDSKYCYHMRPDDCPPAILDAVMNVAENLSLYRKIG